MHSEGAPVITEATPPDALLAVLAALTPLGEEFPEIEYPVPGNDL
jgi:hypothetical protein